MSAQSVYDDVVEQALRGSAVNPGLPAKVAHLVGLQAAHETGGFTSNVFRTGNNAFGYKYVGSRYQAGPGVRSPEGDFYARYLSIQDSAQEVVDWLYRRIKEGTIPDWSAIDDIDGYAAYLKKAGYYGDTVDHYADGLERWASQFSPGAIAAGGVGLLAVAVFFIYWLSTKSNSHG